MQLKKHALVAFNYVMHKLVQQNKIKRKKKQQKIHTQKGDETRERERKQAFRVKFKSINIKLFLLGCSPELS